MLKKIEGVWAAHLIDAAAVAALEHVARGRNGGRERSGATADLERSAAFFALKLEVLAALKAARSRGYTSANFAVQTHSLNTSRRAAADRNEQVAASRPSSS